MDAGRADIISESVKSVEESTNKVKSYVHSMLKIFLLTAIAVLLWIRTGNDGYIFLRILADSFQNHTLQKYCNEARNIKDP